MKLYFVESATADNYIMVEKKDGSILCDNCAPDGRFAGVSLYSYNDGGERISGETIAKQIADAIDPDLCESDFDWMGDPCYESISAFVAYNDAQEYFNRDEAFLIAEIENDY